MKPKTNRSEGTRTAGGYDNCLTPFEAVDSLWNSSAEIKRFARAGGLWEPCAGAGTIAERLYYHSGRPVFMSGIDPACEAADKGIGEYKKIDLFVASHYAALEQTMAIVTNPPYSIKYETTDHLIDLGVPFALLMPVEMIGTAKGQNLIRRGRLQIVYLDRRVNFFMPFMGWEGNGAQFPVAWYCYRLGLPAQMNFASLRAVSREEHYNYYAGWKFCNPPRFDRAEVLAGMRKKHMQGPARRSLQKRLDQALAARAALVR